jgi:hypothetical protein
MPRKLTFNVRAASAAGTALAILLLIAWAMPSAGSLTASAQGGSTLFVRKIALKSNDLVYSAATNKLYASIPSSAGAGGNTITPVDPSTGTVGTPVFIGSESNRLALSDDGVTLYASLDSAFSVRRMNLQTQTPGAQFAVGQDSFLGLFVVNDMAVAPGAPDVVAVDRYYRGTSPPEAGVAIYDNGVQRPKAGEPDAAGLNFWKGQMTNCGNANPEVCRVNVSAAFFQSIEFQQTGYLVYRVHQAAYNRQATLNWRTFLADTQEIGRGVQVGVGDWQAQLEAYKKAFVDCFVTTPEWAGTYGLMSNTQYVDSLNGNTLDPLAPGLGGSLSATERNQLVADLDQSKKTRAEVLRAVAENGEFSHRQSNKAFVLMQYYGYLRRNPNSAPDSDYSGYNF